MTVREEQKEELFFGGSKLQGILFLWFFILEELRCHAQNEVYKEQGHPRRSPKKTTEMYFMKNIPL